MNSLQLASRHLEPLPFLALVKQQFTPELLPLGRVVGIGWSVLCKLVRSCDDFLEMSRSFNHPSPIGGGWIVSFCAYSPQIGRAHV